jgi:hypothetical protein
MQLTLVTESSESAETCLSAVVRSNPPYQDEFCGTDLGDAISSPTLCRPQAKDQFRDIRTLFCNRGTLVQAPRLEALVF